MKHIFTFLTFLVATLIAQAQITIQSSDIGSIGDQLSYISDSSVTSITVATPTGAFQTFDFTSLGVTNIGDIQFLDPATTPSASYFPNSNLAIQPSGSSLIYTVKSASSLKIDGLFGDILNQGFDSPIDLQPNLALINFPLNYQNTAIEIASVDTVVEDTFTGFFDSLRLKRSMKIISLVDAYGKLNLPTLSDTVLRKYDIEITIDSLFGQVLGFWQPVTQTEATEYYYRYLAKNMDYYLLEAKTDSSGNVISAQYQSGTALIAGIVNYSNISCNGLTDGKAKVEAVGGVIPYTYLWDNPSASTTSQINNLPAGVYNVTVTDFAMNSVTAQITIIEPDTISITATQIGPDYGNNEGFINLGVSGGTPGYSYAWSNGTGSKNAINLDFGNYTVTVTDSRGCINTATFTIDNLSSVQQLSNTNLVKVYPNPAVNEITISTPQNWDLKMYSLTGARVFSTTGNGKSAVDISELPTGMYVLEININSQIVTGKIQVTK